MHKESIILRQRQTAVRISNTRVEAVRTKDLTKKGLRVYKDGLIGISGAIGEIPDQILLENALQNLGTGIRYPYALSENKREHRSYNDEPISAEELLAKAESLLETLRTEYPDYDFGETISANEAIQQMTNTQGLDLEYKDAYFSLGLRLKEKKSANLFDGFLMFLGRQFNLDEFWSFNRPFLEAYRNKVDLPKGDLLPVFNLGPNEILNFLSRCLNGEGYATGSSIFSGKLGQKLFNERINLDQDRNPLYYPQRFFDMEGVVLNQDRHGLIQGGKLVSVYTDKKNAALYSLPPTGSASGDYDGMPTLSSTPLRFQTDSKDLVKALNGQPAILSVISSGGDFTPDGSFAAPVQVSFLFDGEALVGKLPEFTMRSHLNKMLGEDYIGTFDNNQFFLGDFPTQLQGYKMTIVR